MLQTEQLRQVAERYADEVAELHGFFASAGVETGTANAVAHVAGRLVSDPAFKRDFLSHIWVILHGHGPQISYADLLGTLALAAAGPVFAAAAQAGDAHDLLRFLMDARHSLEHPPLRGVQPSTPSVAERKPSRPMRTPRVGSLADTHRGPASRVDFAAHKAWQGRRTVALIASAAALATVFLMMWMHRRPPSTAKPLAAALTVRSTPGNPSAAAQMPGPGAAPLPPSSADTALVDAPRLGVPGRASLTTAKPAQPSARLPLFHRRPAASAQHEADPMVTASLGNTAGAPANPVTAPIEATARPGVAIPSSVLSQRLGSRTLPPDYAAGDASYNSKYPRLLRRRPLLPLGVESSDATGMVASNEPPTFFRNGRESPGSATTTVRPVSLGVMAANILYSPAPAYPAAAVVAHVQGEVKVQAEVDRDGNVASARVISGPPLLRDAAMDAVQRWRYRPYLSAGKPVAMSATAVVDFQLQ